MAPSAKTGATGRLRMPATSLAALLSLRRGLGAVWAAPALGWVRAAGCVRRPARPTRRRRATTTAVSQRRYDKLTLRGSRVSLQLGGAARPPQATCSRGGWRGPAATPPPPPPHAAAHGTPSTAAVAGDRGFCVQPLSGVWRGASDWSFNLPQARHSRLCKRRRLRC